MKSSGVTFLILLTAIAIGPTGHAVGSEPRPATSSAVATTDEAQAARCSPARINDTFRLQATDSRIMRAITTARSSRMSEEMGAVILSRIEEATVALIAKARVYVRNHGTATCSYEESGKVYRIDPSYWVQMANIQAKDVSPASTGECHEQIGADYSELETALKAPAMRVMTSVSALSKKIKQGESTVAEEEAIIQALRATIELSQKFRAKHPGAIACYVITEKGDSFYLSSQGLDQQLLEAENLLRRLRANSSSIRS